MVSHFQTIKEISDLGLLDKNVNGAVLPFVNEDGDGYSHTPTVNSTVNIREDEDGNPDGNKDELESAEEPTKDDDAESSNDDGDKTDEKKLKRVEADTLIDAETIE